ncbi:hypothetical protein DPMN_154565 [Dreissena polymorpha]|uniref:Uncharacterized protein n=1 Tax=Dreissena polymorpha TaxID=45954 RepID=A0A9D4FM90_DREPO|nr:hypothetical protein DPMN_154562 [Dreissena polymorpha]KAH3800922.1 hypothetical protein DPMN_154565 [Dreissena polymorpha]
MADAQNARNRHILAAPTATTSDGDTAGTASSDKTSVSYAEMKSERTDGGLETETISVSRSPSPQSFQWASSQSRDTSMPDFRSSSDSKHSSGSESEDQKPNVLSEKLYGDRFSPRFPRVTACATYAVPTPEHRSRARRLRLPVHLMRGCQHEHVPA